jgi:CheY-like chemotaxis protein
VPVVIATADGDEAVERRCRALGCAAFLTKSCGTRELTRVLAVALSRAQPARAASALEQAC